MESYQGGPFFELPVKGQKLQVAKLQAQIASVSEGAAEEDYDLQRVMELEAVERSEFEQQLADEEARRS